MPNWLKLLGTHSLTMFYYFMSTKKIYDSTNKLYNSCPFIDRVINFCIQSNASQEIITDLEAIRSINDILRNDKSEKINYDLINSKILNAISDDKRLPIALEEIAQLKKEKEDLEYILDKIKYICTYTIRNYEDIPYYLEKDIEEKDAEIKALKNELNNL